MPIKSLYFDESGFTGYNLLDPVQPFFVIASADLNPSVSEQILRTSFPRYQGPEFKFSRIWGSNNRNGLIEFGRHFASRGENAYIWMTDKRFGVLTKMVDFLIEPQITHAGYDFYSDGFAWKYTNYIFYGLNEFAPPALLDRMLQSYQEFSRNPSPESLNRLQFTLSTMANSLDEENPVKIFLEQMASGAHLFNMFSDIEIFRSSNELYVTSMLSLIGHWRGVSNDDFAVIHDESAHFLRHMDTWERITNGGVPSQLHQAGDGSTVQFPLRVTSTTPINSRDNFSVQLCDIIAGLSGRIFDQRTSTEDKEFLERVIAAGFSEVHYNGIRPGTIFPDQIPPRELTGPDMVDQMADIIFGRHNGRHD